MQQSGWKYSAAPWLVFLLLDLTCMIQGIIVHVVVHKLPGNSAAKEHLHLHCKVLPQPMEGPIWEPDSICVQLELPTSRDGAHGPTQDVAKHCLLAHTNKAMQLGCQQLLNAADPWALGPICPKCTSLHEQNEVNNAWLQ